LANIYNGTLNAMNYIGIKLRLHGILKLGPYHWHTENNSYSFHVSAKNFIQRELYGGF